MKNNSKENKSERVIVHVRMRPFTDDEIKKDNTTPIETFDSQNKLITIKKEFEKKTFNYDNIFASNSTQKDVYDKSAKGVVEVRD
jgi:hypothetical protein